MGNGARRPTRLPRPRHRPVISRPRSWPTSPSLCSTVARGTRAAPYAASRSFARSPARVMRPQLMTWPQCTTRCLLAVVGRLDDAAAQVADGTEQARREGNAMALDIWATMDGVVHLAAGRLSAARAATESLPPPQRTGVTEPDMMRMVILAEVAARTDDRTLLQQMVNDARDAYSTGSSVVRRGAAHVLALAAWQRDDVHDAMRWLGDITLFESPLWPQVLDQVILGARVASAAGDAGLRARVLQATDLLERERPAIPLFTGVAGHARGILERDAQALLAAADVLHASSRPLLYAAAAEDAGGELARADHPDEAVDQLNAAFDTYLHHEALADARRVGRALRRSRCATSHRQPAAGKNGLGQPHRLRAQGRQPDRAGCYQPVSGTAAARHASHGESPSAQCVRQARDKFPRRAEQTHARHRPPHQLDSGDLAITRPGLKDCPPGNGVTHARAATVVVVN